MNKKVTFIIIIIVAFHDYIYNLSLNTFFFFSLSNSLDHIYLLPYPGNAVYSVLHTIYNNVRLIWVLVHMIFICRSLGPIGLLVYTIYTAV